MATYTNDQLSTLVDALTARLNAIDGANLPDPTTSVVAQMNAKYTGVRADLTATTLKLEQLLSTLNTTVNQYITIVKQRFGLS